MRLFAFLFMLLTSGACAPGDIAAPDAALAEMLEADRAFAAMAERDGAPAAFAAYAADDVRMFPEGEFPYERRDALIARFSRWPDGAALRWTPVSGLAAPSGGFGYTWGTSVFTAPDATGETTSRYGKYISIWRKEPDGTWRFVADMGNGAPAPNAD